MAHSSSKISHSVPEMKKAAATAPGRNAETLHNHAI
jgi:hypothetical protein